MADEIKASKFDGAKKSFTKFFKEIRSELKKVIWPTKQQLINNTATVIAATIIAGVVIWVVDLGLAQATQHFFTK